MTGDSSHRALEKPSGFSLALNFLPFLYLSTGAAVIGSLFTLNASGVVAAVAWVYLVPPLAGRLIILLFGTPHGRLHQDTMQYRVWWILTQLQMLFNRLPSLEELLRLVPGLYAFWIRLWGGQFSAQAYAGPGVLITDRYAVKVERGAVLGFKAVLAGHMVIRDEAGRWVVIVAAPCVEAEAIVGGGAGLGPGAVLRAGHMLPTGRRVGAFDTWPRAVTKREAL
ncbi:MAG: hypothetical protein ABL893_01415 [Hyphomicrobium sp.]